MKIAVLVSGGVDSSVALTLLKAAGHDITAFYIKIWLEDELAYLGNCPWEEDLKYVQAVCEKVNVPLEVVSLQKEYWDLVVKYTIEQVKAGRTPNPDILCNQRIKFGAFFDKIDSSFQYIATGHYAQVSHGVGGSTLHIAPDAVKDQTYFLAHLSQAQLKRALFPIGHLEKSQVRELAKNYDLPNKDRKDSQGICFLGKLKYSDFIRHHVGEVVGDLVEFETNKLVGNHKGFWFYTVGQRQGLGLAGGPWYVVKKDVKNNIVYISKNYHNCSYARDKFILRDCSWISNQRVLSEDDVVLGEDCLSPVILSEPEASRRTKCEYMSGAYRIKVRHGENYHKGTLKQIDNDSYLVQLEAQDQGLASGQFAVIYAGDQCLGCGTIEEINENIC